MEAQVRVGRVVSLQEYWQQQPHDKETQSLYSRARGRCFNVTFTSRPRALACLVFRNFYSSTLRLVQHNVDGSTTVLLDDYQLMQHIHCEDDAQNWHLVHLDKLRIKPDVTRLESLQFYIFQPSTVFETWELEHLKLYESRTKSVDQDDVGDTEGASESKPARVQPLSQPPPSMHQLMRRLSRSSLLVVDARDVRGSATQILSLVHQLRGLIHGVTPITSP